jgi:hypothetical protein
MKKQPRVFGATPETFPHNDKPAFVIVKIEREQIEQGNIAHALSSLMVMTDTRENVLMYQNSLSFMVSGYDNDRRELPEIPEVRTYFKALSEQWPYWLWFLSRNTGTVALFLTLLCQVKILRSRFGSFGTEFTDPEEVAVVLMDLFHRSNPLFNTFNIPEELLEASSLSLSKELGGE